MERSSKSLRRYNYLFSETNAAYHEMSARLGLSDSAIPPCASWRERDTSTWSKPGESARTCA